jgi:hypothetical protein
MKREIKFDDSKLHYALNMTPNEKYISFLNRFFIFKKMTDVNTEDLYNSYFLSDISEPPPEEPSLPEPTEDLFTDLGREEEETSIPNILPEEEKEVENEIVIEPIEPVVEAVVEPPQPTKRKTAVPRAPKEPKAPKVVKEPKEKVVKEPKEKVVKEPKEKVVKEPKTAKEPKERVPRKTTTRKVKKNDEENKSEE